MATTVAALSACGDGDAGEERSKSTSEPPRRVSVSPSTGSPRTTFRVTARLLDIKLTAGDNYQVIYTGRGGKDCRRVQHFELGFVPERSDATQLTVALKPSRGGPTGLENSGEPQRSRSRNSRGSPTWCRGLYQGHVELRDFPRDSENLRRRCVGAYHFVVR